MTCVFIIIARRIDHRNNRRDHYILMPFATNAVKQTYLLTSFCVLLCSMFPVISSLAQKFDRSNKESLVKQFVPPNGRYLYDSIFIDETEIANIHWLEYLHHIAKDSSKAFCMSQLPDTTCWKSYLTVEDSSDLESNYLRYPGTRYFPVVGITYEQAMNYCRWRGDFITAGLKAQCPSREHSACNDFEITVSYRLPKKEEWEYAAAGGSDVRNVPYGIQRPWKGKRYNGGVKRPLPDCLERNEVSAAEKPVIRKMEFNVLEDFYVEEGGTSITCHQGKAQDIGYIYDYPPNGYGLYNMVGNAAELTATKGIAKGGSFEHRLQDCAIEKDFVYTRPQEWIGFRCIAEVHMKKRSNGEVQPIR